MLRRVFKAFSYRDFRLLWFGAFTSSTGSFMQTVAQAWLVFDLSHNAFLLGLDSFLGQIPILLFSLVGGVIADRIDRRRVLLGSQYVQMICAFVLTLLIARGLLGHHVWPILCLSFVAGTAQAFGGPAYQALVPTLVEKEDLANAIALNSIQFNLARAVGPVLGGLALVKLHAAWCFGLNGLSFVAVIISLLLLAVKFVPQDTGESILSGMEQGISFVRRQAAMVALIVLAFLMTALSIPTITFFPVFAKDVLHRGPDVFTIFLACSGVGAVAGALIVAGLGNIPNKGRVALSMLLLLGATIAGFAVSKNVVISSVLVVLSGAAMMGVFSMISSLVQLITSNEMRGRVMSVYIVAFRGGMPLGSLANGWLIPMFSAPSVVAVNGLLLVVLGCYFFVAQPRVAAL